MKQVLAAAGVAAMFAVGLAAQSTTGTSGTAQDPQAANAGQPRGGPRTVTGCLRAGDTAGTYTLTDVEGLGPRRGGDATTGSTTAGGTTTGGTTTTGTSGTTGDQSARAPMSLMLTPDSSVDLKPHVGHKVEVTGTLASGGRPGGDTTTGSSTTGSTTTGGTTTSGTTGTSTSGTSGQTRGTRSMAVTAVKMLSESCS